MPPLARLTCLALTILLLFAGVTAAQEQSLSFEVRLALWNQVLSDVGEDSQRDDLDKADVVRLRDRLTKIRREAQAAKQEAESQSAPLRQRLEALGPARAEGEPSEAPDITKERQSINDELAGLEAHAKQAGLTITKIEELDKALAAFTRERQIAELLKPFPFPLAPRTLAVAVPEFFLVTGQIAGSPLVWWQTMTDDQREQVLLYRVALIFAVALGLGWLLRRLLLRWFGWNAEIEAPTYTRRLTGAIAEGLANGIIPALIFGGILYRATASNSQITGFFADVVAAFCVAMIFLVLARALPRAVLAPELPEWRLLPLDPANARMIARCATLLAAVVAIDFFLLLAVADLTISDELTSVYSLATDSTEAVLILFLLRTSLWMVARDEKPDQDEERPAIADAARRDRFWLLLRILISVLAVVGIIAVLVGYSLLGSYLIDSLLASGVVVGVLVLIRGLLRELIGATLRSRFVQTSLGFRHPTRRLIKFWTRAIMDLVLFVSGILLVLPVWGAPVRDIWTWTSDVLQGFTIGSVTISLTDVVAGLIVFTLAIVITRMLQRLLSERVLPQTTLDSGVQHSLAAGFGYLGIIIATAIGVSTMGLDLSNLALIAGALSVGIGFGLQNVVNNFVSGLILLIERPIKVGDWIVAGGHEGLVKQINVRATELETFQRASVIIPNSELISTAVINWTHKNTLGRVEVPIGVAYGSDVALVMAVLQDCLKAEPKILDWPEPFVLFRNFGDSSLDFEARGFIANISNVYAVASDLRIAITQAFAEQGIEIPFPQRDLHLRDIDRLAGALDGQGAAPTDGSPGLRAKPDPKSPSPHPVSPAGEADAEPGDGGTKS